MSKSSCCLMLVLIFFVCGCASTQSVPADSGSSASGIQEDLSKYRPSYQKDTAATKEAVNSTAIKPSGPVTPKNDVTKAVNARLDSITSKNQKLKYAQGYRVIVYSGNSSEEAKQAKEKVYEMMPNADIYTVYKQPTFRVKVGDCFDRLEANSLYIKLKKEFANALVVPDQINIIKEQ